MSDPFAVLGLTRDATLEQVRVARRTLAQKLHPDVGGDEAQMQEVNVAFEAAVAHLTGRRLLPTVISTVFPTTPPPRPAPRGARQRRVIYRPYQGQRVQHDSPSFTIDALPAEAFEALLVVAGWIGEVAVDDPPYLLEARLDEPAPCWCRLDLVPDAGASTISITVVFDHPMPDGIDAETVRDTWVDNLNRLGREIP